MPDCKLINLYSQMSDLTNPKCAECKLNATPFACCNKTACEITLNHARDVWGIDIRNNYNAGWKVPFLDLHGCRIPPHLRPHCTKYTCAISAFGHDADPEWTKKYFKLQEQINELEWEEFND